MTTNDFKVATYKLMCCMTRPVSLMQIVKFYNLLGMDVSKDRVARAVKMLDDDGVLLRYHGINPRPDTYLVGKKGRYLDYAINDVRTAIVLEDTHNLKVLMGMRQGEITRIKENYMTPAERTLKAPIVKMLECEVEAITQAIKTIEKRPYPAIHDLVRTFLN